MAIDIIRQRWTESRKVYGSENEIITPGGTKVSGRYVVVESGAATPSHNPMNGFRKSDGFPTDNNGLTVNDRDYERDRDAQNVTRNIARNYDSRALQSPCVVSRDGIVLSGNGRSMAGMIAANDGTDSAYISYLSKYSRQYGIDESEIAIFKHPRLLFEVNDSYSYTADTFAMFNAQEMKSQNKTEQAVKLGKLVDDETFHRIVLSINTFDTISDFYNNVKAATEAINELRDRGIISQMQYAEMFDGDAISQHAREILENVLIGKAFQQNPDAVRQITAFRGVRRNIITALAEISANIPLGDYSLETEVAEAIELVYGARKSGLQEGEKVSIFARQTTMFADDSESVTVADYNNLTVMILADTINHTQVTRLKKVFALYNRQAKESASGQCDVFSGTVRTKQDILEDVFKAFCEASASELKRELKEVSKERRNEARMIQNQMKRDMEERQFVGDAGRIAQVLRSFKIGIEDIAENAGPTITLFEITPSLGVRISRIRGLKDEIAAALQVPSVRIIAPMVNGKVGVEVPNKERAIVPVHDILQSGEYENADMELPLGIGRTISGDVFVADLAQMPHLLVAGATGQGKSVGLNVMLMSLLSKRTPDELQLILIDPKQVELNLYSKIDNSYLAAPVITETIDAENTLNSLSELMDERYGKLNYAGVRNIKEYNTLNPSERMPYIVTVIDEYGDLIMTSGKQMEQTICRLAQKARAVGIHLILSTQRPSVTIVTGNIKANFPTRIAFRTTTGTDSRVILDQLGAEKLAGKGDMLFYDSNGTMRMQCAYASLDDVTSMCDSIRSKYAGYNHKPTFREEPQTVSVIRLSSPVHHCTRLAAMLVAPQTEVSETWIKCHAHLDMIEARRVFNQLQQLGIVESVSGFTCNGSRRVLIHDTEEIERIIAQCQLVA